MLSFHYNAAPSGSPQNLHSVEVHSTNITLQWEKVSCIERNSEITGYRVTIHKSGTLDQVHSAYLNGTNNDSRVHTVSELIPRTEYSFRVAAFSDHGEGPNATTDVATTIPEGILSFKFTKSHLSLKCRIWLALEGPIIQ